MLKVKPQENVEQRQVAIQECSVTPPMNLLSTDISEVDTKVIDSQEKERSKTQVKVEPRKTVSKPKTELLGILRSNFG